MFENAKKEVKSKEARREIGNAEVTIRHMAKLIKTIDKNTNAIEDAIRLSRGLGYLDIAKKLREIIN